MAASSRLEIMKLYRDMMRTGQQFTSYNFREYAKRRIRDAFKQHIGETDPARINQFMTKAKENHELIKRQVAIGQMYQPTKLVIENQNKR
eukprot:Seg2939.1 transcript_id=Seg2939.1/GoldUCD/mRNA.D3Y31 product="hypothetical protein" pseudo=true protein_id=Seg2939.1/GoldUCD/D3Y31